MKRRKPLPFRGRVRVGPDHGHGIRGTAPPPAPPLKGRGDVAYFAGRHVCDLQKKAMQPFTASVPSAFFATIDL
ncbi:hypothetical protein GCM10022253_17410 [Sphingomonas endophytica]